MTEENSFFYSPLGRRWKHSWSWSANTLFLLFFVSVVLPWSLCLLLFFFYISCPCLLLVLSLAGWVWPAERDPCSEAHLDFIPWLLQLPSLLQASLHFQIFMYLYRRVCSLCVFFPANIFTHLQTPACSYWLILVFFPSAAVHSRPHFCSLRPAPPVRPLACSTCLVSFKERIYLVSGVISIWPLCILWCHSEHKSIRYKVSMM